MSDPSAATSGAATGSRGAAGHDVAVPIATGPAVDVDLWWADAFRTSAPTALLAPDDRERVARLRRVGDRRRSALATTLVRLAVARLAGVAPTAVVLRRRCPRCGSWRHGPLDVLDAPVDVSVSHGGDLVLVAASASGRVGVDVEPVPQHLEPGLLAAGENPAGTVEGFAAAWSEREALTKAVWAGSAVPPHRVRVDGAGCWRPGAAERALMPRPPRRSVVVRPVGIGPDHRAAVAALDHVPAAVLRPASELLAGA